MKKKKSSSETASLSRPCHCKSSSKQLGEQGADKREHRVAPIHPHCPYTATGPTATGPSFPLL